MYCPFLMIRHRKFLKSCFLLLFTMTVCITIVNLAGVFHATALQDVVPRADSVSEIIDLQEHIQQIESDPEGEEYHKVNEPGIFRKRLKSYLDLQSENNKVQEEAPSVEKDSLTTSPDVEEPRNRHRRTRDVPKEETLRHVITTMSPRAPPKDVQIPARKKKTTADRPNKKRDLGRRPPQRIHKDADLKWTGDMNRNPTAHRAVKPGKKPPSVLPQVESKDGTNNIGPEWTTDKDKRAEDYLNGFRKHCKEEELEDGLGNDTWSKPICSCVPPKLEGRKLPDLSALTQADWNGVAKRLHGVSLGGYWKPRDCIARKRVAIIVPCRDRESHLRALLLHLHPILQRQQLEYRVFVVEQTLPVVHNKAAMMNIGFLEAKKLFDFDCVFMQDVDTLMEDDRNLITCEERPIHYGAYTNRWHYKLAYHGLVGGALSFSQQTFLRLNGFSNNFFGWGGEDDDMFHRIWRHKLKLLRQPPEVARYTLIHHARDTANPNNKQRNMVVRMVRSMYMEDGLNSVLYGKPDISECPTYTHVKVALNVSNLRYNKANESQTYTAENGNCEDGSFVVMAVSLVTCRYQCSRRQHCLGFAYESESDQHCHLKVHMCDVPAITPGYRTYYKVIQGEHKHYKYTIQEVAFHGKTLDNLTVTLLMCKWACDVNSKCVGFDFNKNTATTCWLKQSLSVIASPGPKHPAVTYTKTSQLDDDES